MKKLLFISFLLISALAFSQKTQHGLELNDSHSIAKISAYPNPFSTSTTISFASKKNQTIDFVVKNLLGKTVYHKPVQVKIGYNNFLFSRNNLKRGMYIYTIHTQHNVISKRLIIK